MEQLPFPLHLFLHLFFGVFLGECQLVQAWFAKALGCGGSLRKHSVPLQAV